MAELVIINEDEQNKTIDDFEEKRESLLVLATLGSTKEYLGEQLTTEKIYKMNKKVINKYYSRYQLVQGKKWPTCFAEQEFNLE